jgi:hypothetical protein
MFGLNNKNNAGMDNKSHLHYVLLALLLFVEVISLQWLSGSFSNEYSSFPDEAAHYVSSLMVHDYLLDGDLGNPMQFAEEYYLDYPKVAIGHWPPLFYFLLGVWFIIFGVSRITALCFMAATSASIGLVIYAVAKSSLSTSAAIFAAVIFVAMPLSQICANAIMLEHLVTLMMFLSVVCLAKFADNERIVYVSMFSMFAVLAIFTRGSAWSIGLVPALMMLFAWRFTLLKNIFFWLSAIPVLAFCLPWYMAMPSINLGAFSDVSLFNFEFTKTAFIWFGEQMYVQAGTVISILALIGFWGKIIKKYIIGEKVEIIWAALLAMFVSSYIMHITIPAGITERYLLVTMPAIILFAAAGIEFIVNSFTSVSSKSHIRISAYIIAGIIFGATNFYLNSIDINGYSPAYESVSNKTNNDKRVILIVSDVYGEGSIVATAASESDKTDVTILRGSKVFVHEDWMGRNSDEKFSSVEEVTEVLKNIPVDIVIFDDEVSKKWHKNYHMLLDSALNLSESNWQLVNKFPVTKYGVKHDDALLVYVSKNISDENMNTQSIDYQLVKNLYGMDGYFE